MSRDHDELSLGTLLYVAHRAYEEEIFAGLHEAGFNITAAQGRLAARITEHGIRLTELAEAAGITKQSAAFLVKQLEAARLVERSADPRDSRAQLITLAERGLAAQRTARQIEARIEAEWTSLVGEGELQRLRHALHGLRPHIDRYAPGDEQNP